jgi:hypothetical protein
MTLLFFPRLMWRSGQKKRIVPFFHGCRKRRKKYTCSKKHAVKLSILLISIRLLTRAQTLPPFTHASCSNSMVGNPKNVNILSMLLISMLITCNISTCVLKSTKFFFHTHTNFLAHIKYLQELV